METQKSFYDLDYIVEISEKRVEQYTAAYQLVLGRLANIILVYSVMGIYLIPIVQDFSDSSSWVYRVAMVIMIILISISLNFTIKLMWPVYVAYLEISKHYYQGLMVQYEKREIKPEMDAGEILEVKKRINLLLKASYIGELNDAQVNNRNVFLIKSAHYYRALLFGLMAAIPYVLCIGYHINRKNDKIQKIEIVNARNVVNCILSK